LTAATYTGGISAKAWISDQVRGCDLFVVIPLKLVVFKSRIFSVRCSRNFTMKNGRFSDAQIMSMLKQAQSGVPVAELCLRYGVSTARFYKWWAKFGDMDASLIAEMKDMAEQNRRLKKMYAEMSMHNELLKEALGKKT
jgi:putative transposase